MGRLEGERQEEEESKFQEKGGRRKEGEAAQSGLGGTAESGEV